MAEDYSGLVKALGLAGKQLQNRGFPGSAQACFDAGDAIEALQLKLADAQASAEASARRVVRAETVVEILKPLVDIDALERALDRLAEQDGEQEKSDA